MSFREELLKVDTEKIETIFDDVFPLGQSRLAVQENHTEFMLQEVAVSAGQFPAFKIIQRKLLDMAPRMLADRVITEEQLHGMLMGMTVVQLVLSGYAERDLPDTLPPDFEPGNT